MNPAPTLFHTLVCRVAQAGCVLCVASALCQFLRHLF